MVCIMFFDVWKKDMCEKIEFGGFIVKVGFCFEKRVFLLGVFIEF